MRQQPEGYSFRWTATVVLIIINALVFIVQVGVLRTTFVNQYLALSLDGLYHGRVWQFFTYQFLHSTPWPWHLLLNCWALFVFGREVERSLGTRRFLVLYFVSGIVGGLFQEFVALIWPQYFGSAVVGASAGIFGVVSAFAMLFPERQLTMLLLFVIPVNMRAKYLLLINLLITALGISVPQSQLLQKLLGGHVAHAAHFGGMLAGLTLVLEIFNVQANQPMVPDAKK